MKNELYDGGIYNVTEEWKASHFRTAEIAGYSERAVAICPLYRQHRCYPTCMYHTVTADDAEECFCRYAKRDNDCFKED